MSYILLNISKKQSLYFCKCPRAVVCPALVYAKTSLVCHKKGIVT